MTDPAVDRRSGRRSFLLLASLFFVPFAAAIWLYYSSAWRPAPGAHGELIDPPRPLPAIALTLPDGRLTPPDALRGAWFVIYLIDGPCTDRCVSTPAELARVRLALGNDATRVRRVLLHAGDCCAPGFPGPGDEDLLTLGATGSAGQALLALFPRAPDGAAAVYILDPRGNLMMRHAATGAAQGLLKDLKRLLRLSSIG
jgi:cytochrome oxidase Cu insertion factor (SCO1/SenC/PrrC family)